MPPWPLRHHNRLVLEVLSKGDARQRAAAKAVRRLKLLERLRRFRPLIVGTLPIDVHIPGSDLDVVCTIESSHRFIRLLGNEFGGQPGFSLGRIELQGHDSVACSFMSGSTPIEIVGMPVKSSQQRAYVHLMAEGELLEKGGAKARAAIRRLKRQGLKTEPAFARHFGLRGDPYEAVARLWRAGTLGSSGTSL
jgi:hypothetical protein